MVTLVYFRSHVTCPSLVWTTLPEVGQVGGETAATLWLDDRHASGIPPHHMVFIHTGQILSRPCAPRKSSPSSGLSHNRAGLAAGLRETAVMWTRLNRRSCSYAEL